jgi:hypothetical protein
MPRRRGILPEKFRFGFPISKFAIFELRGFGAKFMDNPG